ncbi:MAG: ubiquinone biosynthesis protein UbiE, partial [Alphaproteobacteria bacterium]
ARMGQPPASDPRAPGPLAFAEPDHVRGILTDAGYSAVEVNSMALDLCPPGSAAEVAAFAAETGPANRIVQHFGGGPADITAIAEDIRREIARHETAQGVRLPGSIRLCTARNG